MKIASADYSLASRSVSMVSEQRSERLNVWTGARPGTEARSEETPARGNREGANVSELRRAPVAISAAARAALNEDLKASAARLAQAPQQGIDSHTEGSAQAQAINDAIESADNDPLVKMIRQMVEMLTGHSIRVFSPDELNSFSETSGQAQHGSTQQQAAAVAGPPPPAGFGFTYDYHAVREEIQQTSFSAEGVIKTADGQEISFKLDLSMTRHYREETSVSIRGGDAVRRDPLVLNFDGQAAQLSDQRFQFDLMGDGKQANIPLLQGNSGYLALDRNGNGKIDSGQELFGPATNAGFDELAKLDSDGNGWIDEGDTLFKSLRVWTPNAHGEGQVSSLAERVVGALALKHVYSPFELRGQNNSQLGDIASTGLYLGEDGRVGTMQEINLAL